MNQFSLALDLLKRGTKADGVVPRFENYHIWMCILRKHIYRSIVSLALEGAIRGAVSCRIYLDKDI